MNRRAFLGFATRLPIAVVAGTVAVALAPAHETDAQKLRRLWNAQIGGGLPEMISIDEARRRAEADGHVYLAPEGTGDDGLVLLLSEPRRGRADR